MSTYWGYVCLDDDAKSAHDFNHGERILRGLFAAWPHILAAQAADTSGYLEFRLMGYGWTEVFEFLEQHAAHKVALQNEYGEIETLAIKEPVSR